MKITLALLQMAACGNNQAANLAKGEEFCRRARSMGADIALFPEIQRDGLLTSLAVEPPFVRVNAHGERYDHLRR